MIRRLDRQTLLVLGLLVTLVVLALLPWQWRAGLDDQLVGSRLQHTTAWTNSIWSKATVTFGLLAGGLLLLPPRRWSSWSAALGLVGLISWCVETALIHHEGSGAPFTVAIANFTAGPHINPPTDPEALAGYLTAVPLIVLILVSTYRMAMNDERIQLSRSVVRWLVSGAVLVLLGGFSVRTWTHSVYPPALQQRAGYLEQNDVWSSLTSNKWQLCVVIGAIGAVALLLRGRAGLVAAAWASLMAVASWAEGAWSTHHARYYETFTSYAIVGNRGPSADEIRRAEQLAHRYYFRLEPTPISFAALAVLLALLIGSALALRRSRAAGPVS